MKKIAINLIALGLGTLAFTACNDAKNDVIENMVYITEGATNSPTEDIVMGNTGTVSNSSFTVSMGKVAAVDTKVKLALDPATLDTYNRRNATEYEMVPAEYVSFPAEVVIEAGKSTVTVPVEVTSFDGEKGVDYAAPIRITDASGELISSGASSYIYTLGKPLVQKAPAFYYDNAMKMTWPADAELPNFTLEWWARCTNRYGNGGFSVNNQALFAFQANYELYIRFGDIVYTVDGRNAYNFLQIKTMGIDANYDSGDPNKNPLQWGEWIHFAHTFDSATGDVVLYMNGKEVNRNNGGAGKVFNFTGLTMCGSGSMYFRDYIEICQVRMWKTTRSAAQIAKFMKKEVKYNDPSLLFYIPMNEGEGSMLHDVTGNGYDLEIGSADNGGNNEAHSWIEYTWE
ncbi:MAG: DUF1735 and LamG domain-containing protein [Paramuribaculum sp.]|nr:DUF1735 and LamG domain-containing protein [Paramuribaculum sp.]